MSTKRIKVLMAKVGLDGHDRGVVTVSRWLRDAGMEVVFLGSFQTVQKVAKTAAEEDVHVIGLSFLGGEHLFQVSEMIQKMKENNLDIPLVIGGIIPETDVPRLKAIGVEEVFHTGASEQEVVECISRLCGGDCFQVASNQY